MNVLRKSTLSSVRSFSTSTRLCDLSRVQLIGRLGADPVIRTAEKTGAPYIVYPIATAAGSWGPADAEGKREPPATSWHSVWCFNEKVQERLTSLSKGATVFVEADLSMKEQPPAEDGSRRAAIPFLMHRSIKVINKGPKHEEEEHSS